MSRPDAEADFARLERVERIAHRMDRAYRIFGFRVGWDVILGLIPGIGDTLAVAPAAYIVMTARRMGVPGATLVRMVVNIFVDWLVGLIPLVGDLADAGYKANTKNARLLRDHVEARHGRWTPDVA